jgi:hypothetical protein
MDAREVKQAKKKRSFKQEKSRSKNLKKEKKRLSAKKLTATFLSQDALSKEEASIDTSKENFQVQATCAAPCR